VAGHASRGWLQCNIAVQAARRVLFTLQGRRHSRHSRQQQEFMPACSGAARTHQPDELCHLLLGAAEAMPVHLRAQVGAAAAALSPRCSVPAPCMDGRVAEAYIEMP
jgi:hypothetical protein